MKKIVFNVKRLTAVEIHSKQLHHLHHVKMFHAALCHIKQGSKVIIYDHKQLIAGTDSLIIFPANSSMEIINRPINGAFHSELLSLSPELLNSFHKKYINNYTHNQYRPLTTPLNKDLEFLWSSILHAFHHNLSETVQEHIVMGLLHLLYEKGVIAPLFIPTHQNLTEQVRDIILSSPDKQWSIEDIAGKLSLSSSTLRRKLQKEGQNFRSVTEETRMITALSLLQTTKRPIADIALQCGYLSSSRFTARFKNHYGCLPKNIR
ncbi:helix-turn-helix transcriptional regulator [Orbaceae bacterium ESL0721]|nr:helix-turn-helix transcriptional regulator [Orbaceae bacterium ESL0721]